MNCLTRGDLLGLAMTFQRSHNARRIAVCWDRSEQGVSEGVSAMAESRLSASTPATFRACVTALVKTGIRSRQSGAVGSSWTNGGKAARRRVGHHPRWRRECARLHSWGTGREIAGSRVQLLAGQDLGRWPRLRSASRRACESACRGWRWRRCIRIRGISADEHVAASVAHQEIIAVAAHQDVRRVVAGRAASCDAWNGGVLRMV